MLSAGRTRRPNLGAALIALALGGCAASLDTGPVGETLPPSAQVPVTRPATPPREFGPPRPLPPQRANAEIARDFLDLTMELETGVTLPVFTRFEEPVTVALTGRVTPTFERELDRLLGRLRREADLDIARVDDPARASITIEAILRQDLDRSVPTAACFVLPRRLTWAEFNTRAGRRDLNWTDLDRRDAASIFIPADISPQEIRDCLHEETAQALGPVNDLFRLEDSIFNDDNMHAVLTGFDMLILRVAYDPALASGMTRAEVAGALPAILARVNPEGETIPPRAFRPSTSPWRSAINDALTPSQSLSRRRPAALEALDIAQDEGWQDTRLGLSLLTAGRLAAGGDAVFILEAFVKAGQVYSSRPATEVHAANVGLQIAAFALAAGEYDQTLRITGQHIPAARRAENAALLSDLLLVRAQALEALGRGAEARATRRDGFGWGRYGLGSDAKVQRRAAEIAALVPGARQGTEGDGA